MSAAYRIEREAMPSGSTVQLHRVIVRLSGPNRWGTVQAGLDLATAHKLCDTLLENEQKRQDAGRVTLRRGIPRISRR